ncbi:MAG: hypothetical protein A3K68_07385 [Euryarchaeota archaeon RBG_16_68_13]|nr:MAG: hypothetical protein A3K68_07385 [Euryarchaeota archaeon RBG_16_68_13]
MSIEFAFWTVNMIVSAISVIVLSGLLLVYSHNFRTIKSTFSVGLVLFAVLFLVQNIAAIALYVSMATAEYGLGVAMPMLALNLAELTGFGVLFWISWQ